MAVPSSRVEPARNSASLRLCGWQGRAEEGRQGGKGRVADGVCPGDRRLMGPIPGSQGGGS